LSSLILAGFVGIGVFFLINDYANSAMIGTDNTSGTINPPDNTGSGGLVTLAWGNRVSPDFRANAISVANNVGIDPNWLMAIIAFETAYTFSPSAHNPHSSATGLIGFLESTAEALGTTVSFIANMDPVQQLSLVEEYLQPYAGRMNSIADAYMAVFDPSALKKPTNQIIFQQGTRAYSANSGLDPTGLGFITKAMAAAPVEAALVAGLVPPNVYIGTVQGIA
jgi:hypothetical protein